MGKYAESAVEAPDLEELPKSADLVGHLVGLLPLREERVATNVSDTESRVTVCRAMIFDTDPPTDCGELFIFWRKMQAQLRGKKTWQIGHVKQSGTSTGKGRTPPYELMPATTAEVKAADEVLAKLYDEAAQ